MTGQQRAQPSRRAPEPFDPTPQNRTRPSPTRHPSRGRPPSSIAAGHAPKNTPPGAGVRRRSPFLTRDPAVALTRSAYGYTNGDPLDLADPSGMWGWNPISDITQAASDAWNATGGQVVHFAYEHPALAAGIALGVASFATGGLALAVGATWVGVGLGATSVAAAIGAAALDAGTCAHSGPDRAAACIGTSLGAVGAVTGLGATLGAGLVVGGAIAEGSAADAALNGAVAGFSFTTAGAGLAFDAGVGIGSALDNSPSGCDG